MPCRISPRAAWRTAGQIRLSVPQAALLGALHGPAELLPVSSSGHVAALPWLLGWRYPELDDESRKSFEVWLHAGSAAAWLLLPASPIWEAVRAGARDRRQALVVALAAAPAGLAGVLLERPIERRLGRPASLAAGLLLGSAALVLADRSPERREVEQADVPDALWLGVAQACALHPGVSRTGATLAAARLRGFSRGASWRLSGRLAAPLIAGATALKSARMARRTPQRAERDALLAGAAASFGSSILATRMLPTADRGWPVWPFAIYRSALAGALLLRRPSRVPTAHRFRTAPR